MLTSCGEAAIFVRSDINQLVDVLAGIDPPTRPCKVEAMG